LQKLTPEETGVVLNWVSLKKAFCASRLRPTQQPVRPYDIINIGTEAINSRCWLIEPLDFGADYDVDDLLPARDGLSADGTLYAHHSTVNRPWSCTART
jgi:sorbitol/mannitol transport system substrate-binding protein